MEAGALRQTVRPAAIVFYLICAHVESTVVAWFFGATSLPYRVGSQQRRVCTRFRIATHEAVPFTVRAPCCAEKFASQYAAR